MMRRQTKLVVQGFPGSFHDEVARKYFGNRHVEIMPAKSFSILSQILSEDPTVHYGIMAIENSIAGSILQNYNLLREHNFWICGEEYLRISHQLMALPGQSIEELHTAESHPMAIYQCRKFFNKQRHISLIESADTALSAKRIHDEQLKGVAAIGSRLAADLYNLEIVAPNIETSKVNYTRFIIISKEAQYSSIGNANKASIYLRVPHQHGSLLKALDVLANWKINISKLQSFPVLGEFNTYYFHLDLEFENIDSYEHGIEELKGVTTGLEELGIYKKAMIYDSQAV